MTVASSIPNRRQWLLGAGAAFLLTGGYVSVRFQQDLDEAERRVTGRSATIETSFGAIEYAVAGSGPPCMMIHGTGGGFDQGLRFASALIRHGHEVISPSRFGYLRSDFPSRPSSANQAEAFAALLDHLAIDRLLVIAGSAGALSAVEFALRYPDRCEALVLLAPAANINGRDPAEMSALKQRIVRALLASDFLYWSMLKIGASTLVSTLLATDPGLLSKVDIGERSRVRSILTDMMPIRDRVKGMLNDAQLAGSPARLDFTQLQMPLLVIAARDDRFGTAATARRIAELAPRATLTILPDGGHIWLGHDREVADRIHAFLVSNTSQ